MEKKQKKLRLTYLKASRREMYKIKQRRKAPIPPKRHPFPKTRTRSLRARDFHGGGSMGTGTVMVSV